MAKPYVSDKEADRIDAEARASGKKAMRAPSESKRTNRVLGNNDAIPPKSKDGPQMSPITDAAVNTAGRLRRGEYINAFTGIIDDNEVDPEVAQDAKGGEVTAESSGPAQRPRTRVDPTQPRVVVNPMVFSDKRDALCVALNEAFRIIMETNGFDPVSEPTEAQRKFFADTAYSQDENMLRRTILARIATFDTSVKDPTDEQLQETVEFLHTVLEIGAPQNEWEQNAVRRILTVIEKTVELGKTRAQEAPQEGAPQEELPQ